MTGEPQPYAAYERLIADLDAAKARYRLIEHAPEGRTEQVSALRGNAVAQAAKCLIVMVKVGKKQSRYVLAVVPGDARLDLQAVKALLGGTYVAFAATEKAEELAGSVTGTVLPFSYDPRLELVADPSLLDQPELFFNAGRLDRSVALNTEDYVRLASPRVAPITSDPAATSDPSVTGGQVVTSR
ncbi:YbaK/prolyl-tRNA synthetase associated domain-containing protein [Nonomuraea sp. FMUSA5-5]|uniref:YbaK/prolyl-tRNA synthetase associated domain-containing protein n=1 Tax=Nonomuraea composti TaxID=2720023 RepID=A0ABX1AWU7_9ACTN|nr:YbaK/prolyl-tRNA synthetase associated domain-containing protein [Nonomuraea sp. FMUSA5-5]